MSIFIGDPSPNQEQRLYRKTTRHVIGRLDTKNAFETDEKTLIDGIDGPKTEVTTTVVLADCGHIVGFKSPSELAGSCNKCGRSLCYRCANLRCSKCLSVICTECSRLYHETAFCKKCRITTFLQLSSITGLKAIHNLLSKDIG